MAFAALITILVGIGELGLHRMHKINETVSDITVRRSDKLQLAREALRLSNRNSRITMEIFLVQDRAQTSVLLAARAENTKRISELLVEIAGRCESEKEKRRLSEVEGARKPYIDSYLRALHLLVDERKRAAAVAVMVNETLPALLKYHAAWDEFVESQKSQLDKATQQAGIEYAKAYRLSSLLIALSVVLALAIALFATYEITRDVERGVRESEERMRMAMEAAKIGLWDWDVIRDKQVWSDTCKALLGLRPDSTANLQVLMNSVHPDDRKRMEEEINAAIQEKREYGQEYRVVWPDGSVHWQANSRNKHATRDRCFLEVLFQRR
jgi:PAS domain S-box-containing protein